MFQRISMVAALALVSATAAAQTFPTTGWVPLRFDRDGLVFNDALEGQPDRDIFGTADPNNPGDASNAAAWIYSDTSYLYVRLRVDGDPRSLGVWTSRGWGCQISIDGDKTTWERMVLLSGKNPQSVRIHENTNPASGRDAPGDSGNETALASYPASTHGTETSAPGGDNYVVFAIPIDSNLGLPGLLTTPIRFVCGSNSDGQTGLTTGGSADVVGVGQNVTTTWANVASQAVTLGCGTFGCTSGLCDPATGLCVECLVDDDCPMGEVCTANTCGPPPECLTSAECDADPAQPICRSLMCDGCASDDECAVEVSESTPACVFTGARMGECVECTPGGNQTQCSATEDCHPYDPNDPGPAYTCVDCVTNDGCAGTTPICNTSTNMCGMCTTDQQCAQIDPDLRCDTGTGRCVDCVDSSDCPSESAPICGSSHTCVPCDDPTTDPPGSDPSCLADDPNQPICDQATGQCEECVFNADCPATEPICDDTSKTCRDCADDNDCDQGVCATSGPKAGECVECTDSARDCDADPGQPICGMDNTCGPCATDAADNLECPADYPTRPACVRDLEDDQLGQCVQCTGGPNDLCTQTQVCDTATHVCVECVANSDCVALGNPLAPECDLDPNAPGTVVNECIGCTGDPGCAGNPVGQACQPDGSCGECNDDDDCDDANQPECDEVSGSCVECVVDGDCSGGRFCDSNVCVDACDSNEDCIGRDPSQPVCNTAAPMAGQCSECSVLDPNDPGLCGTGSHVNQPFCLETTNPADAFCVGCRTSDDCTGGQACEPTGHTCAECTSNADCDTDPNQPFCDVFAPPPQFACVADCPGDYACPSELPVCQTVPGPIFGDCTECAEGKTSFCQGDTPVCKFATGFCVACTNNSHCPGGVCDRTSNQCEALPPDAGAPDAVVVVLDAGVPDAPVPATDAAAEPDAPVVSPDAMVVTPDAAGMPDAPVPTPDATVVSPDAPAAVADARVPDASPAADARVPDASPADARAPDAQAEQLSGVLQGGGCDCRAGSSGGRAPAGLPFAFLAALGVVLTIRRRQR